MLSFVWLLFVSGSFATSVERVIDGYRVVTDENDLKSVDETPDSSEILNLSYLNLRTISEGALKSLAIKILLLSHNDIEILPMFVFRLLRNLEYLSLADNRLGDVRYVFGGLNNVKVLDITNNHMRHLEEGSFYGLTNLEQILHDGNDFGEIYPDYFENPSIAFLRLCMVDGVVESLEIFDEENDDQSANECVSKIRLMTNDSVQLVAEGITGFKKGWYRLDGLTVKSLILKGNNIAAITSEFFNDLPGKLRSVDLAGNHIRTLKNGVIDNNNLRKLDLKGNQFIKLEGGALENAKNLAIRVN